MDIPEVDIPEQKPHEGPLGHRDQPRIWREHDNALLDEQAIAVLVAIMAGGFLLRCLTLDSHLYLDEAISGLAGRTVMDRGFPFFPSGLYYDRDPTFHYILGFAFQVFGDTVATGRMLGILPSTLAIGVAYVLGRRVFDSRVIGLVGALLLAIDPYSISMAARIRMYGLLQLTTLIAVVLFERQIIGPDRQRSRWKWGLAISMGLGVLSHQLFLMLAPAFAILFLQHVRGSGFGVRSLVALAVVGTIVLLAPLGVAHLATREPGYMGKVSWSDGANTSYVDEQYRDAPLGEILRAKVETSAPDRVSSVARLVLGMLVVAGALLLLTRNRRRLPGGIRLLMYGGLGLIFLVLFPTHQLPGRWAVHLAPYFLLLVAGAFWPKDHDNLSRLPLLALGGVSVLAVLASAAVCDPRGALWDGRYFLMAAPLVLAGAAALWRRRKVRTEEPGQRGLRPVALAAAASLVVLVDMTPGLWWMDTGSWDEAGRTVAATLRPGDHVVMHGEDAATLYWYTGQVDAVVPTYRVEFANAPDGHRFEIITGATIVDVPQDLAPLMSGGRIFYMRGRPQSRPSLDQEYFEAVERPFDEWANRFFDPLQAFDGVTISMWSHTRAVANGGDSR